MYMLDHIPSLCTPGALSIFESQVRIVRSSVLSTLGMLDYAFDKDIKAFVSALHKTHVAIVAGSLCCIGTASVPCTICPTASTVLFKSLISPQY